MKSSIKSKVLFVFSLLFGLMFINAGLNKFFNYIPMPKQMPPNMMKVMGAFMQIGWLMPLAGAAEVIGGILIIIPRTRALGALIIFPVMVGIFLTNTVTDKSGLPMTLILSVILAWIMIDNRDKYLQLIK